MALSFNSYLEEGTNRIIEICQALDLEDGEKQAVISAVTEQLSKGVVEDEVSESPELTACRAAILYNDTELSRILQNKNGLSEYERGSRVCSRQRELIKAFSDNGWQLPHVNHFQIDDVEAAIKKQAETATITDKIIKEDKQISELLIDAQNELQVGLCDKALALLNILDEDLKTCKKMHVQVPNVANKDIKRVSKRLNDLRKTSEQKETLHQEMKRVDDRLCSIDSQPITSMAQCAEFFSLNKALNRLLSDCHKNQWPIPALKYSNTTEIEDKYQLYQEMLQIDEVIQETLLKISSNKAYKTLMKNCSMQSHNIEQCHEKGWMIPGIVQKDPTGVQKRTKKERARIEKNKRFKRALALTGIVLLLVLGLAIFVTYKYREGKVRIPFDATYVAGRDRFAVQQELKAAGFESIRMEADKSGWYKSDAVTSVHIDNSDNYKKGSYRKPEVNVVIKYSSPNRENVSGILQNWEEKDFESIVKALKDAGFINVSDKEETTTEKDEDRLIARLSLNGQEYSSGDCYIPMDAPIEILRYSLRIKISSTSEELLGKDCNEVKKQLEVSGFTNVKLEMYNRGWRPTNHIVGVTVDGETVNTNREYLPDASIVIEYSSPNRKEITSIVESWKSMDYETLQQRFKDAGFNKIDISHEETREPDQNLLVSSLMLGEVPYDSGECYIEPSAEIQIIYRKLFIEIGKTAKGLKELGNEEGKNYKNVVDFLKEKGFENIHLERKNLSFINEWMHNEGSIAEISIDGNQKISEEDTFAYDVEIVIKVYTDKDTPYEDIPD